MIIRETKIMECWCPHCHNGQMEQILQKSFSEKKAPQQYVGEKFICKHCGEENVLEDYVSFIPGEFYVSSANQASKWKSNQELKNFLESGDK